MVCLHAPYNKLLILKNKNKKNKKRKKYYLERRDYIKEPELDMMSGNHQDYIIFFLTK